MTAVAVQLFTALGTSVSTRNNTFSTTTTLIAFVVTTITSSQLQCMLYNIFGCTIDPDYCINVGVFDDAYSLFDCEAPPSHYILKRPFAAEVFPPPLNFKWCNWQFVPESANEY